MKYLKLVLFDSKNRPDQLEKVILDIKTIF